MTFIEQQRGSSGKCNVPGGSPRQCGRAIVQPAEPSYSLSDSSAPIVSNEQVELLFPEASQRIKRRGKRWIMRPDLHVRTRSKNELQRVGGGTGPADGGLVCIRLKMLLRWRGAG